MEYKEFECFGVEVREHGELIRTSYFHGIKEAIEFSEAYKGTSAKVSFVTANKWGIVIDRID